MASNIWRWAPSGRLSTKNLYNSGGSGASASIANEFFEAPALVYKTLGDGTLGEQREDTPDRNAYYLDQVTATEDGRLVSIEGWFSVPIGQTAHVMFCVYSDTSDEPVTFLEKSEPVTIVGDGNINQVSGVLVDSLNITAGTKYWVGAQIDADADVTIAWDYGSGVLLAYNTYSFLAYGTFLDPFTPNGNSVVESYRYSFSGTYTTAASLEVRALVLISGALQQVTDAQLGTGLKPIVRYNGGLQQQAGTEGTPMVYDNGGRRELRSDETLLI